MNELNALILNTLLYILVFIIFYKKYGLFNLSTVLFGLYMISSLSSLIYFCNPFYQYTYTSKGEIKLEALFYLFIINTILCSPFRKFSLKANTTIINYDKRTIAFIYKAIFFITLINFICDIPYIYSSLTFGNYSDLKLQVYEEGANGNNIYILQILKRLFGGFTDFLLYIPLFNKFILKQKSKLDYYSLILYGLNIFETMSITAGRYVIILKAIILLSTYIIFKDILSSHIKEKIKKAILIIAPLSLLIFIYISNNRFQDNMGSTAFANLRYAGEAQLNFSGLMYDNTNGCTMGYRMFPLYRRILGLEYYGDKGKNKEYGISYLDKFNPNPNYVYYQLAGELYLTFGKIGAIIFSLIFYIIIYGFFKKNKCSFVSIYTIIICSSFIGIGIFYAEYSSEAYNLLWIYLILLNLIFKKKYTYYNIKQYTK